MAEKQLAILDAPDITTIDGVKKALNQLNEQHNILAERERVGPGPSSEEWKKLEAGYNDLSKKMAQVDQMVKANSSFFGQSRDEQLVICQGSMILEAAEDEELRGMDRNYLNCVALRADEITTLGEVGWRKVPGMSRSLGEFAEDPANRAVLRLWQQFHRLNDMMYLTDQILYGNGRTHYAQLGPASVRMKSLKMWKEWERVTGEIQRALATTTATAGGNWVPTILSANMQDIVEAQLRVLPLFPTITMPSKIYDWPVLGGRTTAFLVLEATTSDPDQVAKFTASSALINKVTFTAKKIGVLQWISSELEEDAIVPALPTITADMGMAIAHGLEDAVVNGDIAALSDASNFYPTGSVRRGWTGLRTTALGTNPISIDMAGVVVTANKCIAVQQAMGAYGITPTEFAWITGFAGYHGLRGINDFQRLDTMGPNAVYLTGQVGSLLGSPVILSEKVVLTDTTGKFSNTGANNTRGTIIGVNRRGFGHGTRRATTVRVNDQANVLADQLAITVTTRDDFEAFYAMATTGGPVGVLRNILPIS